MYAAIPDNCAALPAPIYRDEDGPKQSPSPVLVHMVFLTYDAKIILHCRIADPGHGIDNAIVMEVFSNDLDKFG